MQELRKDPLGFLRQINDGKEVKVIYHSREFATVRSAKQAVEAHKSKGTQHFLDLSERIRKQVKQPLDPNKTTKELYHEMLDNDPKYHGIY